MNGKTQHEREKLKPTWCADDVYMSACESIFAYLKHNDMSWEWFIWLEIKGVQDGHHFFFFFLRRFSKAQKNSHFYLSYGAWWRGRWCWDDGMPRWRKGEGITKNWHSECSLHTLLQSHGHGGVQIPLLWISPNQKKKRIWLSFI